MQNTRTSSQINTCKCSTEPGSSTGFRTNAAPPLFRRSRESQDRKRSKSPTSRHAKSTKMKEKRKLCRAIEAGAKWESELESIYVDSVKVIVPKQRLFRRRIRYRMKGDRMAQAQSAIICDRRSVKANLYYSITCVQNHVSRRSTLAFHMISLARGNSLFARGRSAHGANEGTKCPSPKTE